MSRSLARWFIGSVPPARLLPRAPRATRSPLRISHYSYVEGGDSEQPARQQQRHSSSSCAHALSLSLLCSSSTAGAKPPPADGLRASLRVRGTRAALSPLDRPTHSSLLLLLVRASPQQTRFQTMSNAIIGRSQTARSSRAQRDCGSGSTEGNERGDGNCTEAHSTAFLCDGTLFFLQLMRWEVSGPALLELLLCCLSPFPSPFADSCASVSLVACLCVRQVASMIWRSRSAS